MAPATGDPKALFAPDLSSLGDFTIPSNFDIWGPITIGVLMSVLGMGILLMQVISYFDSSPTDSKALRGTVAVVLALNIAQTVSDCSRMVKLKVLHGGDLAFLIDIKARPEELLSPALSLIISTTAQAFLLRRCLMFTKLSADPLERYVSGQAIKAACLGALLGLGILASAGTGIGLIVALSRLGSLMEATRALYPNSFMVRIGSAWLACSAATDMLLCATLLRSLKGVESKDRSKSIKLRRMLRSMYNIGWASGLVVCLLQIAALLCFLATSGSWSNFPQIFISKVYSITLVASIVSPSSALRKPASPQPMQQPGLGVALNERITTEWPLTPPADHLGKLSHQPYPLRNDECRRADEVSAGGRTRLGSESCDRAGWDGTGWERTRDSSELDAESETGDDDEEQPQRRPARSHPQRAIGSTSKAGNDVDRERGGREEGYEMHGRDTSASGTSISNLSILAQGSALDITTRSPGYGPRVTRNYGV